MKLFKKICALIFSCMLIMSFFTVAFGGELDENNTVGTTYVYAEVGGQYSVSIPAQIIMGEPQGIYLTNINIPDNKQIGLYMSCITDTGGIIMRREDAQSDVMHVQFMNSMTGQRFAEQYNHLATYTNESAGTVIWLDVEKVSGGDNPGRYFTEITFYLEYENKE